MLIKNIYLILLLILTAFIFFDCGGNENKNPDQKMSSQNTAVLPTGNPARGQTYFKKVCSACHGLDGKGLPKLGKNLTTSQFVVEKSDAELMKFIETGRLASDPLNTTGVAMPPKGGNPAFNDQQIMDIVAYVRQIHQ